jgi:hypothetical protein
VVLNPYQNVPLPESEVRRACTPHTLYARIPRPQRRKSALRMCCESDLVIGGGTPWDRRIKKMETKMTSRGAQLRFPLQTAPVSRKSTVVLSRRTGGHILPAKYFWEPGYWCERMGVPPELCAESHFGTIGYLLY